MFGQKLKKHKPCDICTGPLKFRESKVKLHSVRRVYECQVCSHIQTEFKEINQPVLLTV